MASKGIYYSISSFFSKKLWNIRLDKVGKKQGALIKLLRVFTLAVKGFYDDKCFIKATALTYYTLFSIVPVIALVFAIAKGFGYEDALQAQILDQFPKNRDNLKEMFSFSENLLNSTKGGLIAGVGVLLLIFSVVNLLSNIETSFNEIWEIKKGRTWMRKFTDYLAIMIIGPILILASGSITILIQTKLGHSFPSAGVHSASPFFIKLFYKLMTMGLLFVLFTFVYMILPNTRVKLSSAAKAALTSAILFELLQWIYFAFQIGVNKYNAIYGGFAAVPLFLFWVQLSWYVVLLGAELAFAHQNVDHYELEHEIHHISVRYKRILSLLVANHVIKNFIAGGKPMTSSEIAKNLDLPIRLARNIIHEFSVLGIFNEVKTDHPDSRESAYQPAVSESKLTIKFLLDKMDRHGVNEIQIHYSHELENLHKVMDEFDSVMEKDKGNMLVKDIV